ncbi:hypothetical protein OIU84_001325 [Salix udensis]|uniref:Uncharacterized protein n=1 Tax=Salix udensis TaxID=889485 RepID=A0AAD6K787_9ROSI|nr:hypothetical protein OIU84_001325 [Salix udensis]
MEEGMQLIDGNGNFNVEGLKDFMTTTGFADCGLSYAIVAIIGPQRARRKQLTLLDKYCLPRSFGILLLCKHMQTMVLERIAKAMRLIKATAMIRENGIFPIEEPFFLSL